MLQNTAHGNCVSCNYNSTFCVEWVKKLKTNSCYHFILEIYGFLFSVLFDSQ